MENEIKHLKCPKCSGIMMKSYVEGNFAGVRDDGVCGGVNTNKYMCTQCGYIEEYATNPQFVKGK